MLCPACFVLPPSALLFVLPWKLPDFFFVPIVYSMRYLVTPDS